MEIRAIITLLIYSLLSAILTYQTKLHLSNLSTTLLGAQWGVTISLFINILFRRIPCCYLNFNIFSQSESAVKSYLAASLLGAYLGAYFGFNYSVVLTAWETLSSLKFWIIASHCGMCVGVVFILVLSDSSYIMRDIFSMVLSPLNSKISITELVLSMIGYIVVADYASSMGVIYLGFFGVMYYCIYRVAIQYPQLSLIGLSVFCVINLIVNIFRIFYLRPQLKARQEDSKKNLPFSV